MNQQKSIYEAAVSLLNAHIKILEPAAKDRRFHLQTMAQRITKDGLWHLSLLNGKLEMAPFVIGAWGNNGRGPSVKDLAKSYQFFLNRRVK